MVPKLLGQPRAPDIDPLILKLEPRVVYFCLKFNITIILSSFHLTDVPILRRLVNLSDSWATYTLWRQLTGRHDVRIIQDVP